MCYFYVFKDQNDNIGCSCAYDLKARKRIEKAIQKNNWDSHCFSSDCFDDFAFFVNSICKTFGFDKDVNKILGVE